MRILLPIFLFFAFHTILYAKTDDGGKGVDFYVWQMPEAGPRLLLPVPDNETPVAAARRYLSLLSSDPELAALKPKGLSLEQKFPLSAAAFQPLGVTYRPDQPQFLVLANLYEDLYESNPDDRVPEVIKQLKGDGADVYVLPVVADLHLTPEEAQAMRRRIVGTFSGMLALGGDDVDPELYGEKRTFAEDVNQKRDRSEFKLVQTYIESERGAMFGICRGHQLCSVTKGKRLVQDISKLKMIQQNHGDGWHYILLERDSMLFRLLGQEWVRVYSYHHQAVDAGAPSADYLVVGLSLDRPEKLVEAVEFQGGLGFTVQFHPELMDNETGRAIMRQMVTMARERKKLFPFTPPGAKGCHFLTSRALERAVVP